jgi:hypothetical protein
MVKMKMTNRNVVKFEMCGRRKGLWSRVNSKRSVSGLPHIKWKLQSQRGDAVVVCKAIGIRRREGKLHIGRVTAHGEAAIYLQNFYCQYKCRVGIFHYQRTICSQQSCHHCETIW